MDPLAIPKNHKKPKATFQAGRPFEIILIQIKGGGARSPNADDICRLRAVAKRPNRLTQERYLKNPRSR
jgi:hypothetical protein